jgi:hypothetical protein
MDPQGRVQGRFKATGIRPRFADRLRQAGIELPMGMFNVFGERAPAGGDDFTFEAGV